MTSFFTINRSTTKSSTIRNAFLKVPKMFSRLNSSITSFMRHHPITLVPYLAGLVFGLILMDSLWWLLPLVPMSWILGCILGEWVNQQSIADFMNNVIANRISGPCFAHAIPGMFAVDRVCIPGVPGSYKVKYPIRGYATILVSCVSDGYLYYYRTYPYMDGSKHNTLRAVKGMLLRIEVVSYDKDTPVKNCIGAIPLNLQIEWVDTPPDMFEESLKPLADEMRDEIDKDAMNMVRKMMETANADVVGMAPSYARDMCIKLKAKLTDEEIKRFKENLDYDSKTGEITDQLLMPEYIIWNPATKPPKETGSYIIVTEEGNWGEAEYRTDSGSWFQYRWSVRDPKVVKWAKPTIPAKETK